ncbi:MAG: S41 family peptidase [Bacteroidetes bacterium]|nr:S41 family peptidase [Bacteroidota bacterium]
MIVVAGCSAGKSAFSPAKKYSSRQLQDDYGVYETLLREHHPSLYWYTTKDSLDRYMQWGRDQLKDSMTEPQFRKVLSYVTAKIDCGHTSVRPSRAWNKYLDTARLNKLFPLSVKVWEEAMVVTANLNRRDSVLKRGTEILSINGRSVATLTDTLFNYISTDGYNRTHKYQSLSNRGFFGSLYTTVFGLSDKYTIEYKDSTGQKRIVTVPVYDPRADTVGRRVNRTIRQVQPPPPRPSKREIRRQQIAAVRLLRLDTVNHSAMMDLTSFGKGYGLRKFFRNSFRALNELGITHLIIDVRSNGGGSVTNSTILSRYIASQRFKIADSLFAITKNGSYNRYIENHFWNKLFLLFFTRKRSDGNYHFGYFERHYFKPKKKDHYNGKVYIVTGGNSFSATTLFTSAVMKQDNVTVVGEETGGGAYGNTAWLIPDATLPETGVRFRLPLFRLVIDKNNPKNGRGIQPEVPSLPTVDAIRRNADFKMEKVMKLIEEDKKRSGEQKAASGQL